MFRVHFEMYTLRKWDAFDEIASAIVYDRGDASMLILANGNRWSCFNPVRNIQVEPADPRR